MTEQRPTAEQLRAQLSAAPYPEAVSGRLGGDPRTSEELRRDMAAGSDDWHREALGSEPGSESWLTEAEAPTVPTRSPMPRG